MPKTTKVSKVKPVKNKVDSEKMKAQLQKWAHERTEENIEKIRKFRLETVDDELECHAQMAYEEACFFYYNPNDEKEEKEFDLARMIAKRGDKMMDMMCKLGSIEAKLENLKLDEEVHKQVIKNNKDKKDWQYNFSPDFVGVVKNERDEIKDSLDYEAAWIEEAKKMITIDKYKDIPNEVFDMISPDFDDDDFWDDEDEDEDYDDGDEIGVNELF